MTKILELTKENESKYLDKIGELENLTLEVMKKEGREGQLFATGAEDISEYIHSDENTVIVAVNEEDEVETYELAFDGLVVNKLSRTVRIDNELIDFRPKEFDLLVFLIENHRIALDRDRILDAVWGIDYFGDTRVVDTHIKKIRKKLGTYAKYIHTVFGVGYKFEVI